MVVVIGSSNIDFSVRVDRFPAAGETILAHHLTQSFGGKGANQAVGAARAGAQVRFLSKVGMDAHGILIERHLAGQGLSSLSLLRESQAGTGIAMILVDRAGANQIVVAPGSNGCLSSDDVRQHATLMAGAKVLLSQLEISLETVWEALTIAKRSGLTTILNPAPACPLPETLLRLVDILTPNEKEAQLLTGSTDMKEAAQMLTAQGAGAVVVTCGEQGAVVFRGDDVMTVPAFLVEAIDSTGAGDAFNGALACAMADGDDLLSAIEMASAAGALATTVRGAQESMPSRKAIDALLRDGTRRRRWLEAQQEMQDDEGDLPKESPA